MKPHQEVGGRPAVVGAPTLDSKEERSKWEPVSTFDSGAGPGRKLNQVNIFELRLVRPVVVGVSTLDSKEEGVGGSPFDSGAGRSALVRGDSVKSRGRGEAGDEAGAVGVPTLGIWSKTASEVKCKQRLEEAGDQEQLAHPLCVPWWKELQVGARSIRARVIVENTGERKRPVVVGEPTLCGLVPNTNSCKWELVRFGRGS
ncbi:hypothetical protein C8R46DRAFT_1048083 [Mycena filopes]|nr:hypothetical protein C8R46DRAFT_1048083 [Mycena filopes]